MADNRLLFPFDTDLVHVDPPPENANPLRGKITTWWLDAFNALANLVINFFRNSGIYWVTDYGGVGDGVQDNVAAIAATFAAMPDSGGIIGFPAGVFCVTGSVPIPNKSITFLGSGYGLPNNWAQRFAPFLRPVPSDPLNKGCYIWNTGVGQTFANTALADKALAFKGIGFFGGSGVVAVGNLNTNIDFDVQDCMAMFCTGTAFELGTTDAGNSQFFRFGKCFFYNNNIDILQHVNCDLDIEKSVLFDNITRSIELRGANARVRDNTFWGNTGTNTETILIYPTSATPLGGATYNMRIVDNKFGNEDAIVGENVPKIRFGTAAQKIANPDFYIADIDVKGNSFIGTENAVSAITLHSPLLNCKISSNQFISVISAIDDTDATESAIGGNNQYVNNQHLFGTAPFATTGKSFGLIDGLDYGMRAQSQCNNEPTQPVENLLADSEDFGVWSIFAVTVTPGFSDPLGGGLARRLAKSATVGAVVTLGFTTSHDGPQTYSVWLKAGTSSLAVIEIVNSGATVTYARQIVGLSPYWQRYTLRVSYMTSGDSGRSVRIYPGNFSQAVACNIYAFGAQVNEGDVAGGYVRTTTGSSIVGGLGFRAPMDLSVGRDFQVERWVIDRLKVLGVNGHVDWYQTDTGFAYRFTLNNDGTLRLQYSTNGFTGVAATPLLWNGSALTVGNTVAFADTVTLTGRTASKPLQTDGSSAVVTGNIDLTSQVTGILPIANGGTGANSASGARTNLGVPSASTTYTKTEVDTLLAAKADQATTYTKTEVDTLISGLQSQITSNTTDIAGNSGDIATLQSDLIAAQVDITNLDTDKANRGDATSTDSGHSHTQQ